MTMKKLSGLALEKARHAETLKALVAVTEERDTLKAEVERLTHLHKLDHSLADQWLARAEKAEADLKVMTALKQKYFNAVNELNDDLAEARPLLEEVERLKGEFLKVNDMRKKAEAEVERLTKQVEYCQTNHRKPDLPPDEEVKGWSNH